MLHQGEAAMKRLIASAVVCLSVVVVATGDEITGIVTKFEDGKITFSDVKAGFAKKGEAPETTTLPVASNAKFLNAKFNFDGGFNIEVEGDYPGGKDAFAKAVKEAAAKAADAKKADDKKSDDQKAKGGKKGGFGGGFGAFNGVFAQIITEGEGDKAKVTEVRVIEVKGFGKKGGR